MATIKCITFGNDNGSKEGVYFTADLDIDVNDIIPEGCSLNGESLLDEDELPMAFPLEYLLMRS